MARRVFLISPASCSGQRARLLFREESRFDLALRIREAGAPLGEVFAFVSGLYFRGKLAYARRFAPAEAEEQAGTWIITSGNGLVAPESVVRLADLQRFAGVDIDADNPRFRGPFLRDARALARRAGADTQVVLLGSIATGKYVDVLLDVFGPRLLFPRDFVGRGDMSRGGLLLRHARTGHELPYAPVEGTARHGPRPPRLPKPGRSRVPAEAS